jgi:hypothetical protein
MPIPGDNGNPVKEKKEQEDRIREVSLHGADLRSELKFMKPEKTNFGNIK